MLKVVLSTASPKISLVPVVVNKWRTRVAVEPAALRVKNLVQEWSASFRRPFQALMQSTE